MRPPTPAPPPPVKLRKYNFPASPTVSLHSRARQRSQAISFLRVPLRGLSPVSPSAGCALVSGV
jgi:hypothetical protein